MTIPVRKPDLRRGSVFYLGRKIENGAPAGFAEKIDFMKRRIEIEFAEAVAAVPGVVADPTQICQADWLIFTKSFAFVLDRDEK